MVGSKLSLGLADGAGVGGGSLLLNSGSVGPGVGESVVAEPPSSKQVPQVAGQPIVAGVESIPISEQRIPGFTAMLMHPRMLLLVVKYAQPESS